ncbi:MAG: hypothetical protein ACOVMK_03660, partial [Arenimonas sp.]
MRKILLPSLLMLCSPVSGSESLPLQWASEGTQMVIVTTGDWQSPAGRLRTFERQEGQWRSTGQDFPVSIGKNGAGWGLGLHEPQDGGPVKVEGDGKAPAGIFRIGLAFGQPASVA